jgi:hypothetical protein
VRNSIITKKVQGSQFAAALWILPNYARSMRVFLLNLFCDRQNCQPVFLLLSDDASLAQLHRFPNVGFGLNVITLHHGLSFPTANLSRRAFVDARAQHFPDGGSAQIVEQTPGHAAAPG